MERLCVFVCVCVLVDEHLMAVYMCVCLCVRVCVCVCLRLCPQALVTLFV
jgi:hypothetical protein